MRKLCIGVFMALSLMCNAQSNVVRVGDSFMHRGSTGGNKVKADTLITKYKYETKDASYPIIMNKNTGSCYVWRKSKKTGKMYKSYVGEEISTTICKELGVTYKGKKK